MINSTMLCIKTTSISPPQKPTVLGYEFPSLHIIFSYWLQLDTDVYSLSCLQRKSSSGHKVDKRKDGTYLVGPAARGQRRESSWPLWGHRRLLHFPSVGAVCGNKGIQKEGEILHLGEWGHGPVHRQMHGRDVPTPGSYRVGRPWPLAFSVPACSSHSFTWKQLSPHLWGLSIYQGFC